MPDTPDPQYRSQMHPSGEQIEYRQPDDEDGIFEVRLPIATTGEVRNEGDEPLTRDELEGMARQIEERNVGVFLDHGGTPLGGRERYSAVEKVGEWADADVTAREADDTDQLVATARLMDPETLPSGVSQVREAIGAIKEQVKRGFSVGASIGWREDDSFPGGNDLMEASIVGIGADPRTTSDADATVVARAAVDAGVDPRTLLENVRHVVREETPDDERPFGPPNAPNLWDDFDECVADVEDWDGIDDPEAFCGWAEEQTGSIDESPDESDSTDNDMSDQDTDTTEDEPDEQPSESQAQESEEPEETQDETMSAEEFREEMLAMQRDQLALLETLAEDGEDEDDEEEDMEMDEDEDEDDEDEQAADEPDDEQDADTDDRLERMEEELQAIRSGEIDIESPGNEDADADEQRDEDTTDNDTDNAHPLDGWSSQ